MLVILTVMVLVCFSFPAAVLAESFIIDNYDIQVNVLENNRYQVVETLEVFITAPRHGIIRSVPMRYNKQPILIENIAVDGYPYTTGKNGNNMDIKIGDANVMVEGKQVYTIKYDYDLGEDGIKDYDEFYFDLIGTEWDTTINNVNFSVVMPKPFDMSKVNLTRGIYGSTSTEGVQFQINGTTINGRITTPLTNHQALTLALPLPEGYYAGARPNPASRLALYNWFLYPFLMGLSLLIWYRYGKDEMMFPSVQFYPPMGINSADIGYILDSRVDGKDVTSLIFYWADKGHLAVQPEEKKQGREVFRFIKLRDLDADAKDYEVDAFNSLFSYGDGSQVTTEQLKNQFYKAAGRVMKAIPQQFRDEADLWSRTSNRMSWVVVALSIVPIFYLTRQNLIYNDNPFGFTAYFVGGAIALGVNSGLRGVLSRWDTLNKKQKNGRITGASLAYLFMLLAPSFSGADLPLLEAFKAATAGAFMALLAGLVTQKSQYGHDMYQYLLGFREFLNEAERERIEELVDQNPSYFYNILPYAIVLGVTEKWAGKFASIVQPPPDWYYGDRYDSFNVMDFSRQMDNCLREANVAMSSSPTSSSNDFDGGGISSSSGGSSGGGSGGGGGSSW